MRISCVLVSAMLFAAAAPSPAQGSGESAPPACLRFAFGAWTPPLDWLKAGHDSSTRHYLREARPSGSTHRGAAVGGGRESAVIDSTAAAQVLLLLPSWWPAGVTIEYPRFTAATDTVRGVAYAAVADGNAEVPRAAVAIWRVRCGSG